MGHVLQIMMTVAYCKHTHTLWKQSSPLANEKVRDTMAWLQSQSAQRVKQVKLWTVCESESLWKWKYVKVKNCETCRCHRASHEKGHAPIKPNKCVWMCVQTSCVHGIHRSSCHETHFREPSRKQQTYVHFQHVCAWYESLEQLSHLEGFMGSQKTYSIMGGWCETTFISWWCIWYC